MLASVNGTTRRLAKIANRELRFAETRESLIHDEYTPGHTYQR